MRSIIENYTEDLALVERHCDLPFVEEHTIRTLALLDSYAAALNRVDFAALGQDEQIDHILLRDHLRLKQHRTLRRARQQSEVLPLLPFTPLVLALEQGRRGLAASDGRQAADALSAIATLASQAQPAKDSAPCLIARAVKYLDRLRDILKTWFEFYDAYDPEMTWWVSEPYKRATEALDAFRTDILGMKDDEDPPIVGDPIGREALIAELTLAMIPYTPEELIAIGEREMAWCEAEAARVARDMDCAGWREALEQTKNEYSLPGNQPNLIHDLALEAIDFLDEKDLVTVPELAETCWWMKMMSPERQKVNPFFTGGETISVSYPTGAMSHDDKLMSLRGNNIHFARATVHHELIPGHHLQGFMARRHRPYRRVFNTPFYLEGWALWWEMLLWDLGFAESAENEAGMVFWRMHRCARIVFSLKFHLGQMTPQECIDMLVTRVGHEPANAEGEVRRSVGDDYAPLYQCAYMLGGLQLRALHGEL
ncbi:DUF885 family protein, partial [bacterium]|nr:DUF885 family protein [bacterium]